MYKPFTALLLCGALCAGMLAGCAGNTPASSGTAAAPPAASAAGQQALDRYSVFYFDAFDTVTQLLAYCESQEEFDRQANALYADLVAYHQLYDIYNDYPGINNIKTINDNAGIAPVKVDDRILDLLEFAREVYDLTGGRTNIAMGSVLRLWHDCREAAEADPAEQDNYLPDEQALQAAAQHCDISQMIIDREAGTVYLADPEMRLDVGSIGKGYATEMICRAAEARGLVSASVSVGGNLRAMGQKPDGPWVGGVENPWDASSFYGSADSTICAVYTSDLALVTSGDYQRYFVVDGVRYHHLIDPATLYPARYFDSVTVLCSDSGLADGLSTGLFCMTLEEGMALVDSLDGVEALWCTTDGQMIRSAGFAAHERS